ncbi:unnamed protein product [Rhodiola kirilowii]
MGGVKSRRLPWVEEPPVAGQHGGRLPPLPPPSKVAGHLGPWDLEILHSASDRDLGLARNIFSALTKYGHFSALSAGFTAESVARVFVRDVCRLHGLPASIVSDRDPVFMRQSALASVDQLLTQRSHLMTELKANLARARHRMVQQANKHRRDIEFQVGDWLPEQVKIHNVFHVSILKRCRDPSTPCNISLPDCLIAGHPIVQPEKVLALRQVKRHGRWVDQVLIKWKQHEESDATWEDRHTIHCQYPEFNLEDEVGLEKGGIVTSNNEAQQAHNGEDHNELRRSTRERIATRRNADEGYAAEYALLGVAEGCALQSVTEGHGSHEKKVRFGKPPAKPPDDVVIYAAAEAYSETTWNKQVSHRDLALPSIQKALVLSSNWQGQLNTTKTDAKGSKEEIYSSRLKYMFKKDKPYIWVPEDYLHNVNAMIDERNSFSVTTPFPGPLGSILKAMKKSAARVALTGDVIALKENEGDEGANEACRPKATDKPCLHDLLSQQFPLIDIQGHMNSCLLMYFCIAGTFEDL